MGGGSFNNRRITESIERNDTGFGTRVADNTVNRLDIPSTYPPNTERHKLVVNGVKNRSFDTPAFTNLPGKYELTASDGDTVIFGTREQFRYVSNYEALFGMATWYATAVDQLSEGQRLIAELSDKERNNAFQIEFTPGRTECRLVSGGVVVDTLPQSDWGETPNQDYETGDPLDHISRDQPMNPRGKYSWYGVGQFKPEIQYTKSNGKQTRATLGFLSNDDDIQTEEINLKPKIVLDADPGAAEYSAYIGSFGALIRGNATEFDRPRSAILYGLGGDIGPQYANNAPVLAKRHQDGKENVNVKLDVPELEPEGSVTIDVIVGAVSESDTDATGFAAARQGDRQNTAVEYTTNVTTFPTVTRDVPDGNTQVEVPDVRVLATSIAEGEKNSATKQKAGPGQKNKRVLGEDEVALYIPRTAGATGAALKWLRALNRQDW